MAPMPGFITLDSGMGDAFVGSSAIPPGMTVSDGRWIASVFKSLSACLRSTDQLRGAME